MPVEDPLEAEWQELSAELGESTRATPLVIPGNAWELTITKEGQLLVRLSSGKERWPLRLHCAKWTPGRRAAAEIIASGKAIARELSLYRRLKPTGRPQARSGSDPPPAAAMVCKISAWLPRYTPELAKRLRIGQPEGSGEPRVRNEDIEDIDIRNLRKAIRSSWVSFPSQVPALPSCGEPSLQRKIAQLYFVLGWNSDEIAARYGLMQRKVQCILRAWKCRAARAGFIQHIPPAEASSEPQSVRNRC